MAKKSIGEFLSALRKANGYTQQEVADKLNVSNRTLSSWETDRTVPDVFMLPVIADLYGVTADEILRGERHGEKCGEQRAEISSEAKRAVRKNRYGKFVTKLSLFGLLAVMGSTMLTICGIITIYTYSPVWLDILLSVISLVCMVVFSALVFYYQHATSCAEGIILKEDLTEDNRAFMLNIKNKTALFLAVLALPLLICGMVFGLLLIFDPPSYYIYGYLVDTVLYVRLGFVCAYVALALILLAFAVIFYCRNIVKLGNEKQIQTHKRNGKLLTKICCFSAILPVILAIVWVVLYYTCTYTVNSYYTEKDFDKFKAERETLKLDCDLIGEEVSEYSLSAGEYKLNFPTTNYAQLPEGYYDLGNGFWGEWSELYSSMGGFENYWTVYYNPSITDVSQIGEFGLHGEQEPHGLYIGIYDYDYFSGKPVVLVDGSEYHSGNYSDYYFWGEKKILKGWYNADDGYGYYEFMTNDFTLFAGGMFLSGTIASVAISTIVFAVIRKRQSYSF